MSRYKYGVNLLLWTSKFSKNELYLLEKAKKLGCEVVEIPAFNLDIFPVEEVKQELDKLSLEACICFGCAPDADIASLDDDIREKGIQQLKRAIEITNNIGANKIGGVLYKAGGIFTGKAPMVEEWQRSVNAMKKIAEFAKKLKVDICIEQINRYETYFINTCEDAIKYCKDVNKSNIFILLDTHHLTLEELNFYDAIIKTGNLLKHFHTSENNRGIPGTGIVNWEEVFRALKDIKYDGWLVIESFYVGFGNIWKPLVENQEDIIKIGIKNLKKIEKKLHLDLN
ncbi:MAG: sugar phosphate isomerase/epimerase family protein [Promethearchaeia archaeon]